MTRILMMFLLLACQSPSVKNNLSIKEDLENCNTKTDLEKFKGAIPQNASGWSSIGSCHLKQESLGLAKIYFEKALSSDSRNYKSIQGLAEISMKYKKTNQALRYYQLLINYYPNKLSAWRDYTRLVLNHYDLIEGAKGVDKLKSFSNKFHYHLFSTYLLLLRDQKTQALKSWESITVAKLVNEPEVAFTAAYVGYLIDDRIKARQLLEIAKTNTSMTKYNQLLRMLGEL